MILIFAPIKRAMTAFWSFLLAATVGLRFPLSQESMVSLCEFDSAPVNVSEEERWAFQPTRFTWARSLIL